MMLLNHLGEHTVINIKLQKKHSQILKKRQLHEISHQLLSLKNPIWSAHKVSIPDVYLRINSIHSKIIGGEIKYQCKVTQNNRVKILKGLTKIHAQLLRDSQSVGLILYTYLFYLYYRENSFWLIHFYYTVNISSQKYSHTICCI